MSTAIMQHSAMYEIGDIILRNGVTGNGGDASGTAHLNVVGSPAARYTLTRMASTPANASATANLVNLLNLTHRRLERTHSAPAPATAASVAAAAAAAAAASSVNTSRYKTELCRPYEEFGMCKYGDKCQFAHGVAELRSLARHPKYKTELCRTYHTVGFCPYGPRCHFVHNRDEVMQQQQQHHNGNNNRTAAAILAARSASISAPSSRQRPSALSPALSADSPSPTSSLSQSPTSSMSSFFSSEPELHSPGIIDDQRLPVFNRLSAQFMPLGDIML